MDALTRTIDAAILAKDYAALARVFSDHAEACDTSWQSVGQGEQRSLAAHFIHAAVTSTNGFLDAALQSRQYNSMMMQVFGRVLAHLPATVPAGADNTLRQHIFDYMISSPDDNDVDYAEAARILSGMRMDSQNVDSVYYKTPAEIANIHVQIAECFLAEGDEMVAESDAAVTRAGNAVQNICQAEMVTQHVALILRYKTTCARVLDANRKFLQAAQRYHELSTWNSSSSSSSSSNNNNNNNNNNTGSDAAAAASAVAAVQIEPDDLLALLGRAATCAILAPPTSGPQRTRVLHHIYQDARLEQLNEMPCFASHATILKKMARRQILRPDDAALQTLEQGLAEHQKAIMGDGLSILERSVVEHNMIAVSHLYSTIYLSELALILGVTPQRAEKIATNMIMDGTIAGCLDQVLGLLEFDDSSSAEQSSSTEQQQVAWDRSITGFCLELNRVTDAIKAASNQAKR
jgi:COP9 signalosome complex subunit 4